MVETPPGAAGVLIYCDSVIIIYFLEGVDASHQLAAARLQAARDAGDQIAISDLSRLECRVKPLQQADVQRLAIMDGFFQLPDLQKTPLTTAVFDRATALRARFAFKTVDALHLAAAIEARCDRFLTHDQRLARCTEIDVEILT